MKVMLVVEVVVPKAWRPRARLRLVRCRVERHAEERALARSPARTRRASAARDRRAASSVTRRARTVAPATRVCPRRRARPVDPWPRRRRRPRWARPRIGHRRLNHVTSGSRRRTSGLAGQLAGLRLAARPLLPQLHVARTIRLATLETRPRGIQRRCRIAPPAWLHLVLRSVEERTQRAMFGAVRAVPVAPIVEPPPAALARSCRGVPSHEISRFTCRASLALTPGVCT